MVFPLNDKKSLSDLLASCVSFRNVFVFYWLVVLISVSFHCLISMRLVFHFVMYLFFIGLLFLFPCLFTGLLCFRTRYAGIWHEFCDYSCFWSCSGSLTVCDDRMNISLD